MHKAHAQKNKDIHHHTIRYPNLPLTPRTPLDHPESQCNDERVDENDDRHERDEIAPPNRELAAQLRHPPLDERRRVPVCHFGEGDEGVLGDDAADLGIVQPVGFPMVATKTR